MDRRNNRSGFSLVEVLVVTGLFALIAAQFVVAFVACVRLYHGALAQCELSIRMRELREKLLFHLRAPEPGLAYSGLLSGRDLSADSAALTLTDEVVEARYFREDAIERQQRESHRLVVGSSDAAGPYLYDDHAPHDAAHMRWLRPGGLSLPEGLSFSALVDTTRLNRQNRIYLNLALSAESKAGMNFGSRTERIIVPVFGKAQQDTGSVQ